MRRGQRLGVVLASSVVSLFAVACDAAPDSDAATGHRIAVTSAAPAGSLSELALSADIAAVRGADGAWSGRVTVGERRLMRFAAVGDALVAEVRVDDVVRRLGWVPATIQEALEALAVASDDDAVVSTTLESWPVVTVSLTHDDLVDMPDIVRVFGCAAFRAVEDPAAGSCEYVELDVVELVELAGIAWEGGSAVDAIDGTKLAASIESGVLSGRVLTLATLPDPRAFVNPEDLVAEALRSDATPVGVAVTDYADGRREASLADVYACEIDGAVRSGVCPDR